MRDPLRITRITQMLEKAWKYVPDWRLGQLISNLLGAGPQDVFFVEDDEWEKLLLKMINKIEKEKKKCKRK